MSSLTKENYHSHPAISNSMMSWILPECGGSPAKYEEFSLFPPEDEEKDAMRIGSLIHKYMEMGEKIDMNLFVETILPTPGVLKIADEAIALQKGVSWDREVLSPEILRIAREQQFQNNWKDQTIVDKVFSEAGVYMLQAIKAESDGGILVSAEEKKAIERAGKGLEKAIPWNFDLSILPPGVDAGDDYSILREYPIEFMLLDVPCKALIDLLVVNRTKKQFSIYDLKTTGTPLSIYKGYSIHVFQEVTGTRQLTTTEVPGRYLYWHVHRQLAMYNRACYAEFKDYGMPKYPQIIVCETKLPYEVEIFEPPYEVRTIGDSRVLEAIKLLKKSNLVGVGL
jgi:hypothetical protein